MDWLDELYPYGLESAEDDPLYEAVEQLLYPEAFGLDD